MLEKVEKIKIEEGGKLRKLSGAWGVGVKVMLCLYPIIGIIYILNLPLYVGLGLHMQQFFGIFFALTYASGFLLMPATKKAARGSVPWYDAVLAFLSLIPTLYITIAYPRLAENLPEITPVRLVLGTMMLLFTFELGRRSMGFVVLITAIIFLLYAHFSDLIPGIAGGPGFGWNRLLVYVYVDPSAIFGFIAMLITGVIFSFIFMGNLLQNTGGGEWLVESSQALLGRFRGGPAKMSVLASSLFGTISGSILANITVDGPITIPLMKRTGYRPETASAIECVASCGGQIMPPVMGISAFIMAELLGMPYAQIALAAAVPAIMYFMALFIQIDLVAGKTGLKGLSREQLPSIMGALIRSYIFIVPLVVLVYYLFIVYLEPATCGVYAIGSIVLVSMFRKDTRLTLSKALRILELTGRIMISIIIMAGITGMIVGLVNLTGLGVTFSQLLVAASGGNFMTLLVITAVACIILGMGLPIGPCYILLALLAAPALVGMGGNPVAVHLFIIYFGVMSFITPPVCVGVYVAAAIGGADNMKTAWEAIKIGMVAYIVPFLFVFSPALLLYGSVSEIVLTILAALLGFFAFSIGAQGYLFRNISGSVRGLFLIAGIGLFIPHFWPANVGGAVLTILLLVQEWRMRKATRLMEVA